MVLNISIDHLSDALKKDKAITGRFLDLSKALDTDDHEISLIKLHRYGIRGEMLYWFKVYIVRCYVIQTYSLLGYLYILYM